MKALFLGDHFLKLFQRKQQQQPTTTTTTNVDPNITALSTTLIQALLEQSRLLRERNRTLEQINPTLSPDLAPLLPYTHEQIQNANQQQNQQQINEVLPVQQQNQQINEVLPVKENLPQINVNNQSSNSSGSNSSGSNPSGLTESKLYRLRLELYDINNIRLNLLLFARH